MASAVPSEVAFFQGRHAGPGGCCQNCAGRGRSPQSDKQPKDPPLPSWKSLCAQPSPNRPTNWGECSCSKPPSALMLRGRRSRLPIAHRKTMQAIGHVLERAGRGQSPRLPLHPCQSQDGLVLETPPQLSRRSERHAPSRRMIEDFCPVPEGENPPSCDLTRRERGRIFADSHSNEDGGTGSRLFYRWA